MGPNGTVALATRRSNQGPTEAHTESQNRFIHRSTVHLGQRFSAPLMFPAKRRGLTQQCPSASHSSTPGSRTATPAPCPAPPRFGATALLLADRFPARGADPVTVIASTDADDPAFTAWLDGVASDGNVVGHSIREGTPAGTTVVDMVATGTSQGAAATAVVNEIRSSATSFDKQVGGPAAELADVKYKLSARLPYAAPWCAWPRWCCCSS